MTDTALETRGLGDNLPPEGDALTARLTEEYADLPARLEELQVSLARAPELVTTDEQNKHFSDLKKEFRSLYKKADTHRVAEKEFFLEGGRRVHGWFKRWMDPAEAAVKEITRRKTLYERQVEAAERRRREEVERKAREEAKRLEREAAELVKALKDEKDLEAAVAAEEAAKRAAADAAQAQKEARAKAAEMSRSHSDHGVVSSLVTVWVHKPSDANCPDPVDRTTVDLEPLRPYLHMDALNKAVNALVRAGGRELRGVTIFEDTVSRG